MVIMMIFVMLVVLEDGHLDVVFLWNRDFLVNGHLHLCVDGNGLLDGHLNLIGYRFLHGIGHLLLNSVGLWNWNLDVHWIGFLNLAKDTYS